MAKREVPVYMFRGFLEGGKTSFIMSTLQDPYFYNGEKTLIIACEEGMEEYDEAILEKFQATVVNVEEQEELTKEFLQELDEKYKPDRVMFEFNGTWLVGDFLDTCLPKDWIYVQCICLIDASTYQSYMSNMGSLMVEQYKDADMVLFNRCNENTKKRFMRSNVKAVNRRAQVMYEAEEGSNFDEDEDDMPFDVTQDPIEIADEDFGLFYMDALDHPSKYNGKRVHFKGNVYRGALFAKNVMVPGRHAMTCCADDIAFVGFMCKGDACKGFKKQEWVEVTAKINIEFVAQYRDKGPMLYAEKVEKTTPPEEQLVYFT